jgi:gamma-glutamyltranspeptidase/glutathione hydrolase
MKRFNIFTRKIGNSPHQGRHGNRPGQLAILVLAALLAGCAGNDAEEGTEGFVDGFLGGVAGDEPRAVLEARKILSSGGTAADAATAMYFTLAVTMPSSASLGGGGVCMVYNAKGKTIEALSFLNRAPSNIPSSASRPSAVPGNALGFFALHSRYGKFNWARLVVIGEKLARFGTQASRALLRDLEPVAAALLQDADARRVFMTPGGQVLKEGDFVRQPDLANALSNIRANGPMDFYQGKYASFLVDAVANAGGSLSLEDLRAFKPIWAKTVALPVGSLLRKDALHVLPPPTAGGITAGQILAQLIENGGFSGASEAEKSHMLAEASAAAYADRQRWLAPNLTSRVAPDQLLKSDQISRLLAGYQSNRHRDPRTINSAVKQMPENPAATGFVVIDNTGMGVACSLTLNNSFGTGRIAPGTGIVLAPVPQSPGRSPVSLAPMMVVNESSHQIFAAVTASGGVVGATAAANVLARTLLGGEDLAKAVSAPRVHHSGAPDITYHEQALGAEVVSRLNGMGHKMTATGGLGLVNIISCPGGLPRDPETCIIRHDPRGAGLSAGATGVEVPE